ncbi:F-box protein [Cardamine amara subsp. amara]|uniref:F-box protein n=1 Tax=Cardamine amara subsp. amara TaxID=228776 RepID=A0ABD1ALL8_CARAN
MQRNLRSYTTHDLILMLLKGLPVKTLARFLCVSKEYNSIIRNRDFMKSYLIKSSTPPQSLIFTFEGMSSFKHFFFSSPQTQNQGESSSVATYLMECDHIWDTTVGPSVHGLICYGTPSELKVYNPSTRRSITLPKIDSHRVDMHHYLGYDPINGDYKQALLCMMKGMYIERRRGSAQELRVLTLGKEDSWRMVEDFPPHSLGRPDFTDICIAGVLYYVAFLDNYRSGYAIMSFDVRSEKLDLIKGPDPDMSPKLTSYEGKLAVLFAGMAEYRIHLWVLEDGAKHEWSKRSYVLPTIDGYDYFYFHPFCANDSGELILAPDMCSSRPFYVLYYHPKKNSVRRVYIEGLRQPNVQLWDKDSQHNIVSVFSGQVDSLMCL